MTSENQIQKAREILENFLTTGTYRKTTQRFLILREIYAISGHFEIEELISVLRSKKISISRATVYNTLEVLLQCQLVRRHEFGDGRVVYEKSYGYHQHDHLLCLDCGKVFEFCDPRLQKIEESVGKFFGFQVEGHNLTLQGRCIREECSHKN